MKGVEAADAADAAGGAVDDDAEDESGAEADMMTDRETVTSVPTS
jgi:hypothetical protein